jgi:hypothetical protein
VPFQKGNSQARTRIGRKPGVPNKVTRSFRETIEQLLRMNRDKIALWLDEVANGTIRQLEDGTIVGEGPNPAKALDLVAKLAEYAAPKLTRQEINTHNPHAGAHIQIEFVNAPAFSAMRIEQVPPANVIEAEPVTFKAPAEALHAPQEAPNDIAQGLTSAAEHAPLVRPGALERYASRSRTEHEPT